MTKGILIAVLAAGVLFGASAATPTAEACRYIGAGFECGAGERVTGYSQPAPADRHEAGASQKTDAPVAPRAN